MKLLIITNLFPNSEELSRGVFNKQQFAELARLCDIKVVAPVPWFPRTRLTRRWHRLARVPDREVIDGITVYHPRYLVIPKTMRMFYGFFFFLGVKNIVAGIRSSFDFDCILATWAYPDGFAASLLGKRFKVPVVIKVHGSDINLHTEPLTRRWLTMKGLSSAERVIAVSEALKEKMIELGLARNAIEVISNGVDLERFKVLDKDSCRAQLGLPNDKRIILFVGNLVPVKGLEHLIDAVSLLEDDFHLVVVGGGFLEESLKKRVRDYGFSAKVQFVAPVAHDEVPVWMNACDCFCLPSLNEGCPNVVLEALACGRPIVATCVGGLPQIIETDKNGILIEPARPLEMAHAIERALQQADTFRRDETKVASLSWHATAERIYRLIKDVLADYYHYPSQSVWKRLVKRGFSRWIPQRIAVWRGRERAEAIEVALTFDDGPHGEFTPRVLDILQKYNVKATFFLVGRAVEDHPELTRRIIAEGHQIGNHTYDHRRYKERSTESAFQQLLTMQEVCEELLQVTPTVFRPPSGIFRWGMIKAVKSLDLTTVLWSLDSQDWKKETAKQVVHNINVATVRAGDIILFHDDNEPTIKALPFIIEQLQTAGVEFVTVDRFIK